MEPDDDFLSELNSHMSNLGMYILDEDGEPVPVTDALTWGRWFEDSFDQRVLARTKVGKVTISTVFLGMDHGWNEDGPPVLWETMTFCDEREKGDEGYMRRYTSKADALKGHARIVNRVECGICPGEGDA